MTVDRAARKPSTLRLLPGGATRGCIKTYWPGAGADRGARVLAHVAHAELRWFFSLREDALGSAFVEELRTQQDPGAPEPSPSQVRAYRTIRSWLLEMTNHDAGVLKAAYTPGPWPPGLCEELGRLTGIVVRLASVDAGWPDERADQERVEAQTAQRLERARLRPGSSILARYRGRARELLRAALKSYARERGTEPCMAPEVE